MDYDVRLNMELNEGDVYFDESGRHKFGIELYGHDCYATNDPAEIPIAVNKIEQIFFCSNLLKKWIPLQKLLKYCDIELIHDIFVAIELEVENKYQPVLK